MRESLPLGGDIIPGADNIALEMFGDRTKRRQVYHLAETGQLPVFRLGAKVCLRRSTLLAWISEQERKAVQGGA